MGDYDSPGSADGIRFTRDELVWLNNALNEVCNGDVFEDWEFATRLGGSRAELSGLLQRVQQALGK